MFLQKKLIIMSGNNKTGVIRLEKLGNIADMQISLYGVDKKQFNLILKNGEDFLEFVAQAKSKIILGDISIQPIVEAVVLDNGEVILSGASNGRCDVLALTNWHGKRLQDKNINKNISNFNVGVSDKTEIDNNCKNANCDASNKNAQEKLRLGKDNFDSVSVLQAEEKQIVFEDYENYDLKEKIVKEDIEQANNGVKDDLEEVKEEKSLKSFIKKDLKDKENKSCSMANNKSCAKEKENFTATENDKNDNVINNGKNLHAENTAHASEDTNINSNKISGASKNSYGKSGVDGDNINATCDINNESFTKKACATAKNKEDNSNLKIFKSDNDCFYDSIQKEIDLLFEKYPHMENLEKEVANSKWCKVKYNEKDYYVVGIINSENEPTYIAYGVPGRFTFPPEEKQLSDWLPTDKSKPNGKGYWLMYQNAQTGEIVENKKL
ncbi:MAG: hypothetical protein RR374_00180 [Clostridia bacterium]